jgi:hypothetical protein
VKLLIHYFPAQRAALDADYANALSAVADGPAKAEGIAVGKGAGDAITNLRRGDGLEADCHRQAVP